MWKTIKIKKCIVSVIPCLWGFSQWKWGWNGRKQFPWWCAWHACAHHARVCWNISSQMLCFQWSCEECLTSFDLIMILLKLLDSHLDAYAWGVELMSSLFDGTGPPDLPDYNNDNAQAIWRCLNIIVMSISSISLVFKSSFSISDCLGSNYGTDFATFWSHFWIRLLTDDK